MYVLKQFLIEKRENKNDEIYQNLSSEEKEQNVQITPDVLNKIDFMINVTDTLINNTDFSKLYDSENRLFSIGFNVEETNRLILRLTCI